MAVILLFLFLFLFFSIAINLITRKTDYPLSLANAGLLYGAKIGFGCLYGYIFKKYYNGDDTWQLNNDSIQQYKRLLTDPVLFLKELFTFPPTPSPHPLFFNGSSYWQHLEYLIVTKLIAPFNAISQGNYYINLLLFNFLCFWGAWFLYRLISEKFGKNNLQVLVIFLFPPAIFWLSGYRSEGLIFLFTATLLYYFHKALEVASAKNLLLVAFSILALFVLRNSFAILMIPALFGWAWSVKRNASPLKSFVVLYGLLLTLAIASSILSKEKNAFSPIANRQHEFLQLKGTRFALTPLENNITSFVKVLPQAVGNVLVRPYLPEAKGALQWMVAIENLVVMLLLLLSLLINRLRLLSLLSNPFALALLMIVLTNYILIGYTVPFPGAIVRYKIIPELLLLILLARQFKLKNNLI
jgi:hypothetical protein